MTDIYTKRVYESPDPQDGFRVLVDRLWPRGISKELLRADLWMKEAAPSTELRKWYHHDLSKLEEFKQRYFSELDANQDAVKLLLEIANKGRLTLLYSAKDTEHNQAVVLREYLLARSKSQAG